MLNFRYHALSLVAVILALVIGLLLGVAVGDRGLVSSAEKDVRASLRADVRTAHEQRDSANGQLDKRASFEDEAYPAIVDKRLQGMRVALIELGGPSDRMFGYVRDALQSSGAKIVSVSVIQEPLDLEGLAKAARGTRWGAIDVDTRLVGPFAVRLGGQFTQGGTLLNAVRGPLLVQGSGTLEGADGVVVVRNQLTADGDAAKLVETFEDGLMEGLRARGTPVVGVETLDADPSQVSWFKDHDLSSVDDVDDRVGRAALVFALAGQHGAYGQKSTADGGLLPPIL